MGLRVRDTVPLLKLSSWSWKNRMELRSFLHVALSGILQYILPPLAIEWDIEWTLLERGRTPLSKNYTQNANPAKITGAKIPSKAMGLIAKKS